MSLLKKLSTKSPPIPRSQDDLENDPDLRLRIVRTATESIREVGREDDRRKVGKSNKAKKKSRLGILGTIKRRRSDSKTLHGADDQPQSLPRAPSRLDQEEQTAKAENFVAQEATDPVKLAELRRRRNVYVNSSLPPSELDKYGQPTAYYARNKVRTSKYTFLSFLPKNLTEQFKRVANIYFLSLVVLQVFPVFGAAVPQVAMLPLLAILAITGIKDAIEDFRRHSLDNEVNNSAVTRLSNWHNVNQSQAKRNILQRLFGFKPALRKYTKPSKGVRKLRAREGEFSTEFLHHEHDKIPHLDQTVPTITQQSTDGHTHELDDLESVDYEGSTYTVGNSSLQQSLPPSFEARNRSFTINSSAAPSYKTSGGTSGVVDYSRQGAGTAIWERTLWKKLDVGDVVLLRENDLIPADVVVLSSSDQDGTCFVETKNLDGETNLKARRSLKATMSIQSEEDVEHAKFVVDSEPPHANLYAYNAVLRYQTRESGKGLATVERKEAITINELLLRGCAVRNTAWVIGLVVFTGADTKIMLNQGDTPSKRSRIEKETNFNVIANFFILFGMCLACAIADGVYLNRDTTSADFYEPGQDGSSSVIVESIITFGACLILWQNIVPIALVISIEMVKTIQAYFLYQDLDMYYEPLDHPCVPKTWNISDDLGQIEYIFSDKTGTLTANVMQFLKASINGVKYGEGVTEAMRGAAKRQGTTSALDPAQNQLQLEMMKESMLNDMRRLYKNVFLQPEALTFIAPKLIDDLADRSREQRKRIIDFWRALSLCHSVLADRSDTENPNYIRYKAESPDEAALVAAARDAGFVFLHRNSLDVDIEVMGQREKWTPLRMLEFNSTRKRMSVIMRSPDNKLHLICKGADSVIYQRLRSDHDRQLREQTTQDLEEFANSGLRTLCISHKILREEEFTEWAHLYDAACAATENREDEIEKACELIEQDLTLLGATALEDRLQEGVPEAIEQLHQAGIKLWILTGDKLQTAIEIGFSCNLLRNEMDIMIISADTAPGAKAQIEAGLDKLATANQSSGRRQEHAVVIDGDTLRHALSVELKSLFLQFTIQCETVVCCRVSPAQKAQTVRLVKDGKNAMTLAIGDGANDVAMIQEANCGIGIAGLEGAQASMSSDYAIGQFRYLTKLVIVHGRWCYLRIALFHEVFFYKNVIWVFPLFWYQLYCNFNATYLFDYSFLMLYSLVFTSLPVVILGIFDQDVNAQASLAFPSLYKRGIAGLEYTKLIFWSFIIDGLYQSLVCFYVPWTVYTSTTTVSLSGYDSTSLSEMGTAIAFSTILAATLYTGMMTKYWTWLVWLVIALGMSTALIWIAIYSAFPYALYRILPALFASPTFYLTVLLVQIMCLLPRFTYMYITSVYYPRDADIVRERSVLLKGDISNVGLDLEDANVPAVQQPGPELPHTGHSRSFPPMASPNSNSPLTRYDPADDSATEQLEPQSGYAFGYVDQDNASSHNLMRQHSLSSIRTFQTAPAGTPELH